MYIWAEGGRLTFVLFVAQNRLTQVSGHLAGSKSASGGRAKLLEKNPDDVSALLC